jgi:hypothetical protein
VSALICGLIPVWYATKRDVVAMMKEDATGSGSPARTRALLVASQLALSLALLVAAGLLARTCFNLRRAPLGFDPSHVVTMRIDLSQRFRTLEQKEAFYSAAAVAAEQVTGVDAVAFGLPIPLSGPTSSRTFSLGPGERERVA